MLSSKSKGLFVEISGFSILAAVTSGFEPPLTIESLHECQASDDVDEIRRFIDGLRTKKSRAFLPAHCAIYPQSRFVRKTTLDSPAKAKDPNYFAELLSSQFRIDPETNSVAVVNAVDGSEFDVEKGLQNQKELLFCGAGANEITEIQDQLIEYGIYPDTLELGSVSSIGGLKNYSRFKKERFPTLILEITPENSNVFIFGNEQVDICRPIPYGLNSMFPTVQSELGLKDEDSARKLFFSNTFDFTELGPSLLKKMLKELQASTGFYEVQTGQTIGQIF